jgi:acyl transferase domain-containing protein
MPRRRRPRCGARSSALLTDPKSLRRDLEAMIELEKEARGDPGGEAKVWAAALSEAERKREKYQEMYAADTMTLKELSSRLDALEETRETARRELAELASWREGVQTLERDKNLLLASYATRVPEALDSLLPEERRTVYSMLGARVEALPDKNLRIRGAFGEENSVCHHDRTSRRSVYDINPTRLKFTLLSRNDQVERTFVLGSR